MYITLILVFVFLMLDQGTKYLVEKFVSTNEKVEAIPNFLTITKVYNKGAAWSMLNDMTWLLVLISSVASVVFLYFLLKSDWKKAKWRSLSIVFCFCGCFGNLIDRAISISPLSSARPGVIDMIDFKPFDYFIQLFSKDSSFPIFNLADTMLITGVIMLAIDVIFLEDWRKKKDAKPKILD